MLRSVVMLVVMVLLAAPAFAEDKAAARGAYKSASKHYDLGEFTEALHDFKEAYRNYEEPTFLFNIGQCHRQLGQNDQAIRFFRTYLAKLPNAGNRTSVEQMIDKLEHARPTENPTLVVPPPIPAPAPAPAPAPVVVKPAPTPAPVVVTPAPTPPPEHAAVVVTTTHEKSTPIYKKWWLWTPIAVIVVGAGVGLGIGLTRSGTPSAPGGVPTVNF